MRATDFRARFEARAEHMQREAEAARRARAGIVARRALQRRFEDIGEMGEGGVDVRHLSRRHAFLRAEDRGRAVLARQRVVDVGHADEFRVLQPRVEP